MMFSGDINLPVYSRQQCNVPDTVYRCHLDPFKTLDRSEKFETSDQLE